MLGLHGREVMLCDAKVLPRGTLHQ